jgi:flagellar hook protein FlgE
MIDSIFVALSGMRAHERGLNVLSNNISNVNTVGFRGSSASFQDVFIGPQAQGAGQGGASGEQGRGGGVDASRTLTDLRAGQPQLTERDLDLFLNGEGYFVLQDEDGQIRYSRDGRFEFVDGQLMVRGQQLKVMTRDAGGQLVPVTLAGLQVSAGKATTEVSFEQNLSPSDPEHVIDSLTVFDAQGTPHTLRVVFSKEAMPRNGATTTWKVSVSEGTQELRSEKLDFISTSPIDSSLHLMLALKDTSPVDIVFNFRDVTGLSFGTNVQSTLSVQKQDGFSAGTITTQTVDAKGILKLMYSNGQKADGATLALAQISDQQGLVEIGDAQFVYRGAQAVTLRTAGDDLKVQSGFVEQSNVDLTEEFSQLILMQRGYQASSQVLSTANDMLQELFDIRGHQ